MNTREHPLHVKTRAAAEDIAAVNGALWVYIEDEDITAYVDVRFYQNNIDVTTLIRTKKPLPMPAAYFPVVRKSLKSLEEIQSEFDDLFDPEVLKAIRDEDNAAPLDCRKCDTWTDAYEGAKSVGV